MWPLTQQADAAAQLLRAEVVPLHNAALYHEDTPWNDPVF